MKDTTMREIEYQQLKEISWRRRLTPEEIARLRAYLNANPQAQADIELETLLTERLAKLPHPRVSSNFTARVLQAASRAQAKRRLWLPSPFGWLPRGLLPRIAVAGLTVCIGAFSVYQYQALNRGKEAQALASVARVADLPEIEWLADFETIDRMSKVEVADTELLSALQ